MSVVGLDFGTQNSVIVRISKRWSNEEEDKIADMGKQAVARNKGVDVITNEVSNRATP
jgi:molecular chaperone DnaK (HSP70)